MKATNIINLFEGKVSASDVDKIVRKYLTYGSDARMKEPPLEDVVFRVMDDNEWEEVRSGGRSGKFWSSDPTEYGRHAIGKRGQKDGGNVLVAARFDPDVNRKVYRGPVVSKEQAEVAHYQCMGSKGKADIIAVYKWDGKELARVK